jgi:hypothetical protein
MRGIKEYITAEKTFAENHARIKEVEHAANVAKELFDDAEVYIKQDPLQLGALIVCIESHDIVLRGLKGINLFHEIISKASNLEVYAMDDGNIRCSILFNDAFILVNP